MIQFSDLAVGDRVLVRIAPDPADKTPPTFHGAWESDAFLQLLRNTIAWGTGA